MHDNIKTATWWTLTSGQNIGCMRHEVEKKIIDTKIESPSKKV